MAIRLADKSSIGFYKYIYYFVMVVYMSQIVPTTNRMIAGLSSPWIPFLIPIALTIILVLLHPVKFFNKKLLSILGICGLWALLVTIYNNLYSSSELSFQFFLFYSIIIAYIHVQVYGKQLVPLYESIIVLLCKISLPFWLLSVIAPSLMYGIASNFPESNLGHNILYLYNYIDLGTDHYLRNSGCSWEPGRFAIMILLGLYCNILRNGIKWNSNLFWLLATLLTTMSTTGYSIAILMYTLALTRYSHLKQKVFFILLIVPLVAYLFSLDFMAHKVYEQSHLNDNVADLYERFQYHNKATSEGEYIQSLGRFESMYFELSNINDAPILGYGRNPKNSYFYQQISSNFYLTGGLLKIFSMYGLILGIYLYYIMYKSSRKLAILFNSPMGSLLFIIVILSSISYEIFMVPVFTAFWFYGIFMNNTLSQDLYRSITR